MNNLLVNVLLLLVLLQQNFARCSISGKF